MSVRPCPECDGARLRPESLAVKVGGLGIHEFTRKSAREAIELLDELELTRHRAADRGTDPEGDRERLRFLDSVGVGYLTLERAAATLSGGEAQRIRLATQIGSSLVGVLYILDEPSIGLHQRDNHKLLDMLARLRDLGNTVIVVEHDEGTMRAADHIVDLGPGAGEHGGQIVAEGPPAKVERVIESLTGQFLRRQAPDPGAGGAAQAASGAIEVLGRRAAQPEEDRRRVPARRVLLRDGRVGLGQVHARERGPVPGGREPAAPGEAAPGRAPQGRRASTDVDKIINIDQSPIGRTPRSNPATYTGVFDHIRELYSRTPEARARGYKPGRFSFNVKGGRCEVCARRRPDQDRDALPAGRLRAVRAVPRQALQPRDARHPLQGQDDRRRAGDVGRGGARVLQEHPEDQAPPPDAARRRPRLHPPRAAGDDALRRRGAAGQALLRAVARSRPARRSTSSTSRPPGCTSPTSSGCSTCSGGWSTPATRWS